MTEKLKEAAIDGFKGSFILAGLLVRAPIAVLGSFIHQQRTGQDWPLVPQPEPKPKADS
jgi:hypothetical protein